MTGKDLITGISYVDETLIQAAEERRGRERKRSFRRKARRIWAAAACLILAAGGAAVWRLQKLSLVPMTEDPNENPVLTMNLPYEEQTEEEERTDNDSAVVMNLPEEEYLPAAECVPEASVIPVDRSKIALNELNDQIREDCAWYDPDQYSYEEWDEEDITGYYGTEFEPAYLPEGLKEGDFNRKTQAVYDKEGTIVKDTVVCQYYQAYDGNGNPIGTEDEPEPKGFTMMISRLGEPGELLYVLPREELQVSDINGNEVIFGYRSYPYGPYDPVTKEAAGYYDLFDVKFEKDGIYYEIVARRMELDEVIKVAASILYGNGAIEVK